MVRGLVLQLDPEDWAAIQGAMEERRNWEVMPASASNRPGALLAEIARDWLEMATGSYRPAATTEERGG